MLLIGTKLCKRTRRPFFHLSLYPLSICHVIFFSPSLRNFYNRQISMPLCSCPLATWNAGKKKKCPDEYTASQEDLLIGGSLSPCVVELRTNPFPQLNETVQIPHDGPRQQLLEWVGRMRSERKRKGKHPRPPPTVHTPWSHLNQSWNPSWPCLLWSLSPETSTFRIKMILTSPSPNPHTKADLESFFGKLSLSAFSFLCLSLTLTALSCSVSL